MVKGTKALLASLTCLLATTLVCGGDAWAQRGQPVLVSLTPDNRAAANDISFEPSISADGRYVAFTSHANNLSPDDDNSVYNVFVRDLVTNTTTLVSRASGVAGEGADAVSLRPDISANGRYVVFVSDADNLSSGANGTVTNVFRRDLQTNETTLVSITYDNTAGANGSCSEPSISADGRYVAFGSHATNLSPDDLDGPEDIFRRDIQEGTTTLVSFGLLGAGGDDDSRNAAISADGRYVAFDSEADNLSADDINSVDNVFVRDVGLSTTTLVNYSTSGEGADNHSRSPSISADANRVAFTSYAKNLSDEDGDLTQDIFVRDLAAGITTLVSQGSGGVPDNSSSDPSISPDGRRVTFYSGAGNLVPFDTGVDGDVFLRDLAARTTTMLTTIGGKEATGDSQGGQRLAAGGRYVVFTSAADNLSAIDDNSLQNVFRQDLVGPPPSCPGLRRDIAHDTPTVVGLLCADVDGDPVTFSIVSGPSHGQLGPLDRQEGLVAYTPDPGFTGQDSFRYRGADASGVSQVATASMSVQPPAFGSSTLVSLSLAARRIPARGPVTVRVRNRNAFAVTGSLRGATARKVKIGSRRKRVRLARRALDVDAGAAERVRLRLPRALRRLLRRDGRLALRLTATVEDPAGNSRTVAKRVTPRLRKKRR